MPTVTATGHATIQVPSATALVRGQLEATASNPALARDQVVKAQRELRDAVDRPVVFDQLRSHRAESRPGGPVEHVVVVSLRVDVDDPMEVANTIEGLTGVGVQVHGTSRLVAEDDPAHADVREAAVVDAKEKASHYAAGAGYVLGDLVSVSDGGTASGGPIALRAAAESGLELDPGDLDVHATATVTYELARR